MAGSPQLRSTPRCSIVALPYAVPRCCGWLAHAGETPRPDECASRACGATIHTDGAELLGGVADLDFGWDRPSNTLLTVVTWTLFGPPSRNTRTRKTLLYPRRWKHVQPFRYFRSSQRPLLPRVRPWPRAIGERSSRPRHSDLPALRRRHCARRQPVCGATAVPRELTVQHRAARSFSGFSLAARGAELLATAAGSGTATTRYVCPSFSRFHPNVHADRAIQLGEPPDSRGGANSYSKFRPRSSSFRRAWRCVCRRPRGNVPC